MNYQRQTSNGTTLETINGKHYVNGVEVNTGEKKPGYYLIKVILYSIVFAIGFVLGTITQ